MVAWRGMLLCSRAQQDAHRLNGKRRDEIEVSVDLSKDEIEKLVLDRAAVIRILDGNAPKKLIVVPGKIVNVVV